MWSYHDSRPFQASHIPGRLLGPSSLRSILLTAILLVIPSTVWSARVQVTFDVSPSVACRDISTDAFRAEHPNERLFEARLNVSMLVPSGSSDHVIECRFQFYAPERRLVVEDFVPRTTLVSGVVGNINVKNADDTARNLQLALGGRFESMVSGDVSIGGRHNKSAALQYEMLPPREAVTAAGTIARGSGVVFKLKQSAQTSLEGSHEFVVIFRVPDSWRGDYFRAECQAESRDGRTCGHATFLIPLFALGDELARTMAWELHEYEEQLIGTAHQYQKAVRRASLPTLAHELLILQPTIPDAWLSAVVAAPAESSQPFESSLPTAVQAAIGSYRRAKTALATLPTVAPEPSDSVAPAKSSPPKPVRMPMGVTPIAASATSPPSAKWTVRRD